MYLAAIIDSKFHACCICHSHIEDYNTHLHVYDNTLNIDGSCMYLQDSYTP